MATFCVRVKATEFQNTNRSFKLLVVLCKKLGPQLTSLQFTKERLPSHAQISMILDACTYLHFRIDAIIEILEQDSFAIFRDRLRSITIDDRFIVNAKEARDSVPSVALLDICVSDAQRTGELLSNFFFAPKHALKSLHFCTFLPRDDNSLDTLAGLVTSLEVLQVSTMSIAAHVFRRLANANKKLKTVSIAYETLPEEEKGEDAEIVAVSIVEDFAKCLLLTELELRIRAVPGKSARIAEHFVEEQWTFSSEVSSTGRKV